MYRTATRLACVTPGWGFHVPLGVAITDTSDVEYRTRHNPYKVARFESIDTAVAISNKEDTALIQTLLTKWDFVLALKSDDYSTYQSQLKEFVNHKARLHAHPSHTKHPTVREYLGSLLRNTSNPSTREQPPHYVDTASLKEPWDYQHKQSNTDHLYLGTIPKDLLLGYWQSWGLGPLEYYAWDAEKRQVYSVDLAQALSGVCTRFELTTPAGCMSCPMRGDCLNHLSSGQLNSSANPQVTLSRLQHLLKSKFSNYVPPLLGDVGDVVYQISDKLNYSNLNFSDPEVIERRLERHKYKASKLRDARKFYEENCSQCARNSICGSSGIIARDRWGQGPELAILINKDHCFQGKGPLQITEETFPAVVQGLLTLICENYRGRYKAIKPSSLFQLRNTVQAAAKEIVDWVFSAAKLDRYASACLRAELHPTTSVLPKPVMLALESLGLKGGYSAPTYYYAHNLTGLQWLRGVSSPVSDCLPGITPPASDWVVCTTTGRHVLKSTESSWSIWSGSCGTPGGEIAQFVDASLFTQVVGLDTRPKPLRRFSKVSERMVLCLDAIYKYATPTREVNYGPFGSQRELAPLSSLVWYGQGRALTRFGEEGYTTSKIVRLILESIAKTPAKVSRLQLERISSIGRKSPNGKTKTQPANGKSSGG